MLNSSEIHFHFVEVVKCDLPYNWMKSTLFRQHTLEILLLQHWIDGEDPYIPCNFAKWKLMPDEYSNDMTNNSPCRFGLSQGNPFLHFYFLYIYMCVCVRARLCVKMVLLTIILTPKDQQLRIQSMKQEAGYITFASQSSVLSCRYVIITTIFIF